MDIIKKINKVKKIWEILPELTVEDLEEVIKLSADRYYNTSESLISDEYYDALTDKLRELNPESDIFKQTGAPTKGKKVRLPYWMGSMNKAKTPEEIDKDTRNYSGPFIVSDKLDGISCLLILSKGKYTLYTRGDGSYGQNITHLFDLVNMSDEDLVGNTNFAVRGELIMSKKNFEKYAGQMANARNMVAGIVNSKPESVNKTYAADTDFIAYELIEPILKPSDQMKKLKSYGFNVVHYDLYTDIDFGILDGILQKRKKKSVYEIDGIIIGDNKKHARNTSGNPPYSFAYKGKSQNAITKVIEVLWKPGKDGHLKPRIHYEPVHLSGATLKSTTGFNARYIKKHRIGPGAEIRIVRSGDTIPYIMDIIRPAKRPSLPDVDYEWNETEVEIILKNASENKTVIIQRLTKFLRDIEVKNMSEGIVTKLVNAGYDSIPAVMKLKVSDLLKLEGFQQTLSEKLIKNLDEGLSKLTILKLMVASNCFGRGFGERKLRRIMDEHPSIVAEYTQSKKKAWSEKLVRIEGFDILTVNKFLSSLPEFQDFYKNIKKIRPIKPHTMKFKKNGTFTNAVIVFTGFRKKEWKSFIESEGGRVSDKISKNTTLLIYNDGEESSSKYLGAKKLGIETIPKSKFGKKYGI